MDLAFAKLLKPRANVHPFLDILVHTTDVVVKELAAQEFDCTPLIYVPQTMRYREMRSNALTEAAESFLEQSRQLEQTEKKIARERLRVRRMYEACSDAMAPISGLPLELLHEIFLHALDDVPKPQTGQRLLRTRLSLTCKHWCRAVRSCEKLWTYLEASADAIGDLGPALSLAPHRGAYVALESQVQASWTFDPALRGKISALRIAHNAPLSVLDRLLLPTLPHLSSIYLHFRYASNKPQVVHVRVPGRSLPELGHLTIEAPMISSITFDGADVKRLILSSTKIRLDKTIKAISEELPGLQEIKFGQVTTGSSTNSPIVTAHLPPTLQKLTLDHSSIEVTKAILSMHMTESTGLSGLRELIMQLPSVHPYPPGVDHTNVHLLGEHGLPLGFAMAVAFAEAARRMLDLEKIVVSAPVRLVQHLLNGMVDDANTGMRIFPKLNHMDLQVTDPLTVPCDGPLAGSRASYHHCSHDLEEIKALIHLTIYERQILPGGSVFLRASECLFEPTVRARIRELPRTCMEVIPCRCVDFW